MNVTLMPAFDEYHQQHLLSVMCVHVHERELYTEWRAQEKYSQHGTLQYVTLLSYNLTGCYSNIVGNLM